MGERQKFCKSKNIGFFGSTATQTGAHKNQYFSKSSFVDIGYSCQAELDFLCDLFFWLRNHGLARRLLDIGDKREFCRIA